VQRHSDGTSGKQEASVPDAVLAGNIVWSEHADLVWTRGMPLRIRLVDGAHGVGTRGYPLSTGSSFHVLKNVILKMCSRGLPR